MMDHEYFDAKFEGIEKLMAAHEANLHNYIDAVSLKAGRAQDRADAAAKEADEALDDHKADIMAHGAGATVKVIGAATAMCASLVAVWRAIRQ